MANTQELGLKIWAENEDPDFRLWRTEVNGSGESDMVKIDRFAKKTNENVNILIDKVEQLETDLFIPTIEQAIQGVMNEGYMTPYLVAQAIAYGAGVGQTTQSVQLKHVIKSVSVLTQNQKEFEIPMENYNPEVHFFELRIGGVPFFHERYSIVDGKVILKENEVGIQVGKRVDFVFCYLEQVGDNKLPVHGVNLLNGTITENKLSQELQDKINNGMNDGVVPTHSHPDLETAISFKADQVHIHTELEDQIKNKAEVNHSHKDLETLITGKADAIHSHDGYAKADHAHIEYAQAEHIHNEYSPKVHTHEDKADINHTHEDLVTGLATKAEKNHTHDDKADKLHTHDDKADVNHVHTEYASAVHAHTEYASQTHTHEDKANVNHEHTNYATTDHVHNDKADKLHASEHGVGGTDVITVAEEMLTLELRNKINSYSGGEIVLPSLDDVKADVEKLKNDITTKSDKTHNHDRSYAPIEHSHSYAPIEHTHNYAPTDHTHADKADVVHTHDDKADKVHTHDDLAPLVHSHSDLAEKTYVDGQVGNVQKEVSSLMETKADIAHNHDTVYAQKTHAHEDLAKADHNHDLVYSPIHNHPYASDTHNHNGVYAPVHDHPYSPTDHNHNGVYAPISHSHNYAPSGFGLGTACVAPTGNDWNNALSTGFYMGSNMTNAPNTDWWMGYVICHNENWIVQVLCNFNNTKLWKQRVKSNGVWQSWTDFGAGHRHSISEITGLQGEIDSLKSSVSSGKTAVANAITAKGVATSTTAEFATMASNIAKISTGMSASEKKASLTKILKGTSGIRAIQTYGSAISWWNGTYNSCSSDFAFFISGSAQSSYPTVTGGTRISQGSANDWDTGCVYAIYQKNDGAYSMDFSGSRTGDWGDASYQSLYNYLFGG